jgi:argininosuccinate lyase
MPGKPTWAGRLPGGLAPEVWTFLHSLPHDRFLWPYDIEGTIAHVAGLETAGVLRKAEAAKLRKELRSMKDHAELIEATDEDVHTAIERVLTERLGDVGAKVHAGRSRNDQVATTLRLWVKDELPAVLASVAGLLSVLLDRAEEHVETLAPGYTHLQRAQPVTLGHWLCAHAHAFARDVDRLRVAFAAADCSPLGAGALAGSTFGVDPKVAAGELGFSKRFSNSIDAVSDRDFLVDAAYACAMAMTHLSRLGEEIVLWSSAEFGFVELPDRYATGSSMMPQKRNPDVAELARGQTGLAVGALTGLLVTLKALPLAYDRDLQADKRHVREVFSSTREAFAAMAGLMSGLRFDVDRLAAAASDEMLLATDAAEELVRRGTPFRAAHEEIGGRVRAGLPMGEGGARGSIAARSFAGGPSPRSVRKQVAALRRLLQKRFS